MARVWFEDGLVDPGRASIDPGDRGFTLGDGCFDTALAIGGRVFLAEHHIDRLAATCRTLSLSMERAQLEAAQNALAEEIVDGSVRLTVTRGTGARGLAFPCEPRPTLFGSTAPLAPQLMFKPMTLAVAETRRNETSLISRHKTLNYLDQIIETDRAKASGADEPLFLNTKGRITSTALANLFVWRGENLVSPLQNEGVLEGVMRRFLIETITFSRAGTFLEPVVFDTKTTRHFLATNSLRLIAPARLKSAPSFDRFAAETTLAMMDETCLAIRETCGRDPRHLGARFPDFSA